MAEENKSFFPNVGLLSDSSLTGLNQDLQDQLQREATKRMILGGLLSGRADVGFQSAVGVPTDYFARQNQIIAQQQLANIGRAAAASTTPTTIGVSPGSDQAKMIQQDIQDFGPDANRTINALYSNKNLPRELDKNLYVKNIGNVLASSDPTKWAEFQKNTRAQSFEPGSVITDAFDPTKILTQMPGGLEKGMQWGKNPQTGLPEVQMMPGFVGGVAARVGSETRAKEENTMRDTVLPTGEKQQVFPNTGVGGTGIVTGLSTAQTVLNEQYKPILENARKGYEVAKSTDRAIDQLQNAFNDPGFETGSFTNLRTDVGSALQSLGVTGKRNSDFLVNSLSARRGFNELTGEALKEAVGAISNFEIGYYGQRNAQITDPKESTNFNLAVLRETNNRKKAFYNFVADPKNAGGDVLQKWEASPQGSKSLFESPNLRKYLPQEKVGDEYGGKYKGQTKHQLPNGKWVIF